MSDLRSLRVLLLAAGMLALGELAGRELRAQPGQPGVGAGAPLTLGRAVELALAAAPEVAEAAAAARGDQAAERLASDAFRPAVELSTTPGVGRGLPVAIGGRPPSIVTFDLHQSLFNSDLRSEDLATRATAAATAAARERARVQATRATVDLYARCWTDQQLLAGADRRLTADEAMSRRAAALREQGRVSDLDLAQARLREARARLRRMEATAAREVDLWELRRRLGLAVDAPLELPADLLAAAPAAPGGGVAGGGDLEAASAADPELRSTAEAVDLLRRSRQLRERWFAPVTVDADAQYSRLSRANGIDQFYVKFREDDWSVALVVAIPLWTGGRLRDGLARADANLDRLNQRHRARAEQVEIEVHRAQSALGQAQGVARQASAVAEEDLRISGALAAEGRAQPDDLDTRQAALADAQEEEIKAAAALLNARVQLLALRGELLAALGLGMPGEPAATSSPRSPGASAPHGW